MINPIWIALVVAVVVMIILHFLVFRTKNTKGKENFWDDIDFP